MKKVLLALLGAALMAGATISHASPEQDRKEILDYLKHKSPNIPFEDYVYGALAYSPDALDQYKAVMDFPPFIGVIDEGKKMWDTPFKNGQTYAGCMPNGGKNIAGNYPMFDNKLNTVVTLQMVINECREKNGEKPYAYKDMKTMGVLTAYMRTLSDGMKTDIKVEGPAALAAYEHGKKHFFQRRGQLNFSCATCHLYNAGNIIRTEYLSPILGHSTHWPVFRGGEKLFTLEARYVGCNKTVRAVPFEPGSDEYKDLEYFESYISNGLPLEASVFRK